MSLLVFLSLIIVLILGNAPICQAETALNIFISTSPDEISRTELAGYDILRIVDGDYIAHPGEPMVASKIVKIALPVGMKATGIEVIDSESSTLDGAYNIYPSQTPRLIGHDDEAEFIPPVEKVYRSAEPYPGKLAELIRQSDLAGQSYAVIRINPLQYIPARGEIILYNNLELRITGESGYICGDYLPGSFDNAARAAYESMLQRMVINPEAVQLTTSTAAPIITGVAPGDYDYVIITSNTYTSAFQSLADWKTKKGVLATVVTTTWIYNQGGYTGTYQNKIRQFVTDAYATWGARYFLLGGDVNIVPTSSKYVRDEYVANDTYYGDFDDDWTCEVQIGRASVISTSQANTFINKVLTYEKNPPLTNYSLKASLFGFDLDDYTDGEDCMVYIDNNYIPSTWTITNVYDSHSGDHVDNARNAMNAGQNLVNHIDHCNAYYLGIGSYNHDSGWDTGDVDAFYNGNSQSVFYTLGCHANAYDESYSISEHMIRDSNGGAVAYIGNSRNGIYWQGDTDSYSFRIDRYFFRSLFQQSNYKVGDCFSDHKNDSPVSDETWQYLFTGLNLLGDPEMPIWTNNPQTLTVDHPATLQVGQSEFTVNVMRGTAPATGSYVCLMKGDEVYLANNTDVTGNVTFYPEPQTTGIMYVTVTKHDFLPVESQATVELSQGAVGGIVRSIYLELLEGVFVSCANPAVNTSTNQDGEYVLMGFETGTYDISFSHSGYLDTTVYNISITAGDTATLDMNLIPYPDDVGASAIISPTDTVLTGMPVSAVCEVLNHGTATHTFDVIINATLHNSSTIIFADTATVDNMPGGSIDTVNFARAFTPAIDTVYDITVYTILPGDMDQSNDLITSSIRSLQGDLVWYGNLDLSPVMTYIGEQYYMDAYVQTSPDVYAGDILLCLGVMDEYITSWLSESQGHIYYPLTEWTVAEFFEPETEPNPPGWSSQSLWAVANLARAGAAAMPLDDAPWLHLETPTKIASFALQASEDTSLANDIVYCFGRGYNSEQGESNSSDSLGNVSYKIVESYSPVYFRSPSGECDYKPGDSNSDGLIIGSDVTFMVGYFRGINHPADSCWNELAQEWLYSALDANGDCKVIGSDVTFMVSYFRGLQPVIHWCPETPPVVLILDNSPNEIRGEIEIQGTK